NFQGAEVSFTNDTSSRIDSYGERQASITAGFGDLAENRFNIYGAVNMYRRDAIPLSDFYDNAARPVLRQQSELPQQPAPGR
ncbi:hypothetical protein, partial [Enterobacter hormaechei]|uniref:hypothetical protein n=1 Tax=Enterobacter hormaechei TaxID=158836 RepID=UPI00203C2E5F